MCEDSLFVITGASRGFGKQAALACATTIKNAYYILVARNEKNLNATKAEMLKINANAHIRVYVCDFALVDTMDASIASLCEEATKFDATFKKAVLINNHGTIGTIDWFENLGGSASVMETYMAINYTSFFQLTNKFSSFFKTRAETVVLVNISSLCAVQATENYAHYCPAKAARDMLYEVLGKEADTQKTAIRTLNYAPGPMNTDMGKRVRLETKAGSLKAQFEKIEAENQYVDPYESSIKMLGLLTNDKFKNGQHIDYYDI